MPKLLVAPILLLLVPPAFSADAVPNFSGRWRFNPQQSDDATTKIEEVAGSAQVKGAGRSQLVASLTAGKEVDRVHLREFMLERVKEFNEVEIEQSATEFKFIDATQGVGIFYFDREHVRQDALGQKLKCHTSWKDGGLVIEQKGDKTKSIQIFTLAPSGQQITQVLRFESKLLKQPLELRRVYDRTQ